MTTFEIRSRQMRFLVLAALLPGLLLLGCNSEPEPSAPAPSPQAPPQAPPRVGEVSDFYTVAPCQIVDTKAGAPLASGETRTFPIAGAGCDVPEAAVAVMANVVTTGTDGKGLLVLRSDADRGALEIGFEAAGPRSTHVLLPLSPDGTITAATQGAGSVHFQLQVSGYFLSAPAPAPAPAPGS